MENWWGLEARRKNIYAIYILIISVLFLGGCTQEQCLRIDSNAYEVKLYQEFNSVKPVNGCLKLTADTGESTEDLTITYYPDCLVAEFMDNGKKAAIFDMEGNQLSQIYDSISPLQGNESYYVVEKDEEFGLADINGKEVMEPSVDYIGAYSEGVLHFVKNKKYGYQTLDGTIEIPAKFTNYDYEHPYIFRGGTALLQGNGGPQGAINKKGEVIVPSGYDWYTLLENGYVKVHQQAGPEENEGLWGLYDNTGKLIIPPTYFTEIPDKDSGKLYMDSNDGLLQFEFEEFMRSGLVDMNGKVVVPPKYGRIDRFGEGFAVVTQEQQGGVLKYDYIDRSGKQLGELKWDSCGPFSEGLGCVMLNENNVDTRYTEVGLSVGYLNPAGEIAIPVQFQYRGGNPYFQEGLACVSRPNKEVGFIDQQGKWVIEASEEWDSSDGGFKQGRSSVKKLIGSVTYFGLIDQRGTIVIPVEYEGIDRIGNNLFILDKREKFGLFDKDGAEILAVKYDAIENINGVIIVTVGDDDDTIEKGRYRLEFTKKKQAD